MAMRLHILIILLFLSAPPVYSQAVKREMKALRISEKPKIDGVLSEECWKTAQAVQDFVQYEPYNGSPATYDTRVMIVYDDNSIYVGAVMYDSEPDKIMLELGPRDSDELNADAFLVSFSTYNDGLNSFEFFIYASGVQVDVKNFSGGSDISWDAVWKSEVSITQEGWVAEIEIPYSALRFPKTDQQTWGLNFAREVRRMREITNWNLVDKDIDGVVNQAGLLTGIENIKPPLRLSFEPYVSTSVKKEPGSDDWDFHFNGGMDLKYGINESFTLDMTLIPDFSQVPSDDQVVNLGPFETYYSEKRQFFTEGVELFSRGNVFYSRRVGSQPIGYEEIEENYPPEDIIENPGQTRLINATKLSGRTSSGTGVGVFNAMTLASYATVRDSTGAEKEVMTQPFTNYNMLVADQSLPNNSFISLYNTNVYRGSNEYSANVTGTEMKFKDRLERFSAYGMLNVSQKYYPDTSADLGFAYNVVLEKIKGNAHFGIWQDLISDTYDPNDLGFLENNNEFENGAYFSYSTYDPFWIIRKMDNELVVEYSQLYAPREFSSFNISFENRTEFKNILTVGLEANLSPVESRDYFEPRHEGWFVKYPASYAISGFYSPDYNKTFLVDVGPSISWGSDYDQLGYYLHLAPRYRVNDHLIMVLTAFYSTSLNNIGYVTDSLENNDFKIIFGKRDVENITTTLSINYTINPKFSFSFRVRHYLFEVDYDQYYDLGRDGSLTPTDYAGNYDFIYNAFNIDTYFTWLFAPGSELILTWKNAIYSNEGLPAGNYFHELANTLEAPASNLISLKLLYYLDSQYFKKLKKKSVEEN
jgi:hypothetical protein